MLAKVSKGRHAVVGAAIGGSALLAATGVIGASYPERFDSWQSVLTPAGGDAVRIDDTFDQDFGSNERRGHLRFIEHDFGAPTDITASSESAPDDLGVTDLVVATRVAVGDPDVTITGRHRYQVGYTLPDARVSTGGLAVDVLSPSDDPSSALEIGTFEVVVTGFVLDDPVCTFGPAGSTERCDFVESRDGFYRAVVEPLEEGAGVTVGGTIVAVGDPEPVEPPPLPERRSSSRGLVALGTAGLGTLGAFGVYRWARHRGRNEVFAGGAADAAFGELPPPGSPATAPPVSVVTDAELNELATIEFVPPDGIDPWEGSALLRERLDDDTVESWLSGLAGAGAVTLGDDGGELSIAGGPDVDRLDPVDRALLQGILDIDDPYVTGEYDARFARAWAAIGRSQRERIGRAGWWKHHPPGGGLSSGRSLRGIVPLVVFAVLLVGSSVTAIVGLFGSWSAALAFGLIVPSIAAYGAYRVLLPQRSAVGSALALRTESFRRFLHAGEARHVEWAWEQGLLREYSGWAVALGEADAWSNALDAANVPPPARGAGLAPIIVARRAPSIRQSRVRPHQSGGGGGSAGGFSAGSVGGGGGGSSRGSW